MSLSSWFRTKVLWKIFDREVEREIYDQARERRKDLIKQVSSPHFTRGGTGVTNFTLHGERGQLRQYTRAVRLYGDPNIFVSMNPMQGPGAECSNTGSLHTMSVGDLGDFWKLFKSLKQVADYR
jgi:hypothetical protein